MRPFWINFFGVSQGKCYKRSLQKSEGKNAEKEDFCLLLYIKEFVANNLILFMNFYIIECILKFLKFYIKL